MYYCEELFVMEHKSKYSCASAIIYDLGPNVVARNCHFDNIYMTVPSGILDGGQHLFLANVHGPSSLKYNSFKPALKQTFGLVDRGFLCDW